MHPEKKRRIACECALVAVALLGIILVYSTNGEEAEAQIIVTPGLIDDHTQWPLHACVLDEFLYEPTRDVLESYDELLRQGQTLISDDLIQVIPPDQVVATRCSLKVSEESKQAALASESSFMIPMFAELARYEFFRQHLLYWDTTEAIVNTCTMRLLLSHEFFHALVGTMWGYDAQDPNNSTHSLDQRDLSYPRLDLNQVHCEENQLPFLSDAEKEYLIERFTGEVVSEVG